MSLNIESEQDFFRKKSKLSFVLILTIRAYARKTPEKVPDPGGDPERRSETQDGPARSLSVNGADRTEGAAGTGLHQATRKPKCAPALTLRTDQLQLPTGRAVTRASFLPSVTLNVRNRSCVMRSEAGSE